MMWYIADERSGYPALNELHWQGEPSTVAFGEANIYRYMRTLDQPLWVVKLGEQLGLAVGGGATPDVEGLEVVAYAPPLPIEALGEASFRRIYGTRCAFYAGAMANGIASEEMVIALGREGLMGSFGAGGLSPQRIEAAVVRVKEALPDRPYLFNLLNSPFEPQVEEQTVGLYLKHGIRAVEAAAYLMMTANLVHYRAAGLSEAPDGSVLIANRVIAKLSRKEVARRFLAPAPADILKKLVETGKISAAQARLAERVPMADDITVEADSGGHTDNRPLVAVLPSILALRDEFQEKYRYPVPVRVGAAGGIGTPVAALAAFMLGAAYIVTGSINQGCLEAGTSAHVRKLLAEMEMTDVAMAPAADMFEMGTKVQVLKRGTMFAMRASKLYELYARYNAWEEIPIEERQKLESQILQRDFESVWNECVAFFSQRDPRQVERGERSPKDKMALVFRWYLGQAARWATQGEAGRELDYQVWCGPAMGAFNQWVQGTPLAEPANRHVVNVSRQILTGCAYLYRLRLLEAQGIIFPPRLRDYRPEVD